MSRDDDGDDDSDVDGSSEGTQAGSCPEPTTEEDDGDAGGTRKRRRRRDDAAPRRTEGRSDDDDVVDDAAAMTTTEETALALARELTSTENHPVRSTVKLLDRDRARMRKRKTNNTTEDEMAIVASRSKTEEMRERCSELLRRLITLPACYERRIDSFARTCSCLRAGAGSLSIRHGAEYMCNFASLPKNRRQTVLKERIISANHQRSHARELNRTRLKHGMRVDTPFNPKRHRRPYSLPIGENGGEYTMCLHSFMNIMGVYIVEFRRLVASVDRGEGTGPVVHAATGKTPNYAKNSALARSRDSVREFVRRIADEYGVREEDTNGTSDEVDVEVIHLPPSFTMRNLYQRYCRERGWDVRADATGRYPNLDEYPKLPDWSSEPLPVPSWASFRSVWASDFASRVKLTHRRDGRANERWCDRRSSRGGGDDGGGRDDGTGEEGSGTVERADHDECGDVPNVDASDDDGGGQRGDEDDAEDEGTGEEDEGGEAESDYVRAVLVARERREIHALTSAQNLLDGERHPLRATYRRLDRDRAAAKKRKRGLEMLARSDDVVETDRRRDRWMSFLRELSLFPHCLDRRAKLFTTCTCLHDSLLPSSSSSTSASTSSPELEEAAYVMDKFGTMSKGERQVYIKGRIVDADGVRREARTRNRKSYKNSGPRITTRNMRPYTLVRPSSPSPSSDEISGAGVDDDDNKVRATAVENGVEADAVGEGWRSSPPCRPIHLCPHSFQNVLGVYFKEFQSIKRSLDRGDGMGPVRHAATGRMSSYAKTSALARSGDSVGEYLRRLADEHGTPRPAVASTAEGPPEESSAAPGVPPDVTEGGGGDGSGGGDGREGATVGDGNDNDNDEGVSMTAATTTTTTTVIELPSFFTVRSLYERYCHGRGWRVKSDACGRYPRLRDYPRSEEWPDGTDPLPVPSWASFRDVWRKDFPHLVIAGNGK